MDVELNAERTGGGSGRNLNLRGKWGETLGGGISGLVNRFIWHRSRGENKPDKEYSLVYKWLEPTGDETQADLIAKVEREQSVFVYLRHVPGSEDFLIPSLRISREQGRVGLIETDLTQNGRNLVFSWNERSDEGISRLRSADPKLLDIWRHCDLEKLMQTAQEIGVKCAKAKVQIPEDCYFCVVQPDGQIRLVIADLGGAGVDTTSSIAEIMDLNREEVDYLQSDLQYIKSKL